MNENEFNAKQEFNNFSKNNENSETFVYFVNAILKNKVLLLKLYTTLNGIFIFDSNSRHKEIRFS